LTTLSHEFHTPLAVIEGYTATLLSRRQQLAREEQDDYLHVIHHAARQLEKLTDQLLELAQFEAGSIHLDHSLVDITVVARKVMSQVEGLVPEPLRGQFDFVLQCRNALGQPIPDLPLINGDVQRIYQVLEQLLENAIKFSPAGGRIDVIIQLVPQAGRSPGAVAPDVPPTHVEICVCDLGIGIPEEHLEQVFDPFYRVDTRLSRDFYGLGLGLTACKHVVALHQGRIWAESCPDGGCAVHVWLPLADLIATPS
jgi:signal transduction histidine kinase